MEADPTAITARISRAARTARITPELVWFLASPHARANPYPAYARLRRLAPVHHSPLGVHIVSGHAQVAAALHDPTLSSDQSRIDLDTLHIGPLQRVLDRGIDDSDPGPYFERVGKLMLFRDPPDHTRLRSLVNRTFTPSGSVTSKAASMRSSTRRSTRSRRTAGST